MRPISETAALVKLAEIRERFRRTISTVYESRAKDCTACETKGVCCTDEHFVNVRITRLEATAIKRVVERFDDDLKEIVLRRIVHAANLLKVDNEFFACPLYEKGIGCLVHKDAKPMPCIFHACYERREDLPPPDLLDNVELDVAGLNRNAYGSYEPVMPIPAALAFRLDLNSNAADGRREPSSDRASEQK